MKITSIESMVLSYQYQHAIADAQNYFSRRNAVIILVHTDSGITGLGESACFGGPPESTKFIIDHELAPMLIGRDPTNIERLWKIMFDRTRQHGRRGIAMAAMSGIGIALWDILGKTANLPVYKLLGGYNDRLLPYASSGFYREGKGAKELADEVAGYFDSNFRYAKIKVGRNPEEFLWPTENMAAGDQLNYSLEEDLERITLCCREADKAHAKLIVDANNAWTTYTAIRMGRECQRLGVFWLEEPVAVDNIEGSVQVAQALDIPVGGYESEVGLYGFRDLITRQAVDIVQPDVVWSGGITECRKIAALAQAHGMPANPHVFSSGVSLAANMHFLASMPNGGILEMDQNEYPLRTDLLTEPIERAADGYVYLPQKPGLGIELNQETVERYRVM